MQASTRFVKAETPVLQDVVPQCWKFVDHPFFHKIPNISLGRTSEEVNDKLQAIEEEVLAQLVGKKLEGHRYGANLGVNLGLSFVGGGGPGKGYSGTIQHAAFVKDKLELRKRLYNTLGEGLGIAYGNHSWYKRLVKLTQKLNQDCTGIGRGVQGCSRTIHADLPISAVWLTVSPKGEAAHCDGNVVATFLLRTQRSHVEKGAGEPILHGPSSTARHHLQRVRHWAAAGPPTQIVSKMSPLKFRVDGRVGQSTLTTESLRKIICGEKIKVL